MNFLNSERRERHSKADEQVLRIKSALASASFRASIGEDLAQHMDYLADRFYVPNKSHAGSFYPSVRMENEGHNPLIPIASDEFFRLDPRFARFNNIQLHYLESGQTVSPDISPKIAKKNLNRWSRELLNVAAMMHPTRLPMSLGAMNTSAAAISFSALSREGCGLDGEKIVVFRSIEPVLDTAALLHELTHCYQGNIHPVIPHFSERDRSTERLRGERAAYLVELAAIQHFADGSPLHSQRYRTVSYAISTSQRVLQMPSTDHLELFQSMIGIK